MKKKPTKEELFVQEYLVDLNGTAAAKRAGFAGTRGVLATTAYKLLRKPEISKAIRAAMDARAARVELHQDEALQQLLDVLRADIGELFDEKGVPLALEDMPDHMRRNIQSIEVEELFDGFGDERKQVGRMHKLRLWSKDKALELALRHKGLLNDKLLVKDELTLEQLLHDALKPPEAK